MIVKKSIDKVEDEVIKEFSLGALKKLLPSGKKKVTARDLDSSEDEYFFVEDPIDVGYIKHAIGKIADGFASFYVKYVRCPGDPISKLATVYGSRTSEEDPSNILELIFDKANSMCSSGGRNKLAFESTMMDDLKEYIYEAETDTKDAQVRIYQDNIEEVTSEIDSINIQIRSLMESNSIPKMLDNGTIDSGSYENATAGYSLIYKDLFAIREKMNESLTALTDLLSELVGEDVSAGSKIETE